MRELWSGTNGEGEEERMVRAEARGVANVRAGVGTNG